MKYLSKQFFLSLLVILSIFSSVPHAAINSVNEITPREILSKMQDDKNVIFIDVRNGFEYDEESIPNAIMINGDKLVKNFDLYRNLFDTKTIIVHCKTGIRGVKVAKSISQLTTNKVYNMKGGIQEWKKQHLPTQKAGISIMRQVQMIAGALIVLFSILAFYKNKKFLFLTMLIGCGLFYAGMTGFCGMAILLKMMPWN